MRNRLQLCWVVLAVMGAAPVGADYYATKEDYREGRLTAGPAAPKAGGNACLTPRPLTSLPFVDTGSTIGADNSVRAIPIQCNDMTTVVAGPDHIYEFTVLSGNTLTFTLSTTTPAYDPSIYLLGDCNDGDSCLLGSDECLSALRAGGQQPFTCASGEPTEAISTSLLPGTYYFFVDSFYSSVSGGDRSQGDYTLTVTGNLPVELLEFTVE